MYYAFTTAFSCALLLVPRRATIGEVIKYKTFQGKNFKIKR